MRIRDRLRGIVAALHIVPLLVLLWYGLTAGAGWMFGAAAVIAAGALGRWLAPFDAGRIAVIGSLQFVAFFLFRSLLGGFDVGWRALHPRMPLNIHVTRYPLQLPMSQQRTVFISVLSLLPGTLSCDFVDGRLRVHSISGDPERELARLERRVRALFRGDDEDAQHNSGNGNSIGVDAGNDAGNDDAGAARRRS